MVWNYERLGSFFGNFDRIRGFDPERDRVTVVSCSPSEEETALVRGFERETGFGVRYLTRRNRGREQLARLEYLTGQVGSLDENLSHAWVFQMQDHYLDLDHPASRWDARSGWGIKGDVAPEGLVFDLGRMEQLAEQHVLDGFFADSSVPCLVERAGRRFIAPNGSNFALRADLKRAPDVQVAMHRLMRVFESDVKWLTYVEYMWGPIFFREGRRFYDLERKRAFTEFRREDFRLAPDDYEWYFALFERPGVHRALRRLKERMEAVARQVSGWVP